MRNILLTILIISAVFLAGCQETASYSYRYRAGTWAEYNRLMDGWIPNNATEPPLPPEPDSIEGNWVRVTPSGRLTRPYPVYSQSGEYIGQLMRTDQVKRDGSFEFIDYPRRNHGIMLEFGTGYYDGGYNDYYYGSRFFGGYDRFMDDHRGCRRRRYYPRGLHRYRYRPLP